MSVISKRNQEINDFLFKWLSETITKYPIVIEDQHEPRPLGPYISFKLITGLEKMGLRDEKYFDPVLGVKVMRGFRSFTTSISAIGQAIDRSKKSYISATDLLGLIQWSLDKDDVQDMFTAAGVGVIDCMNVIDTTELEENIFVPSAVLDIRMSTQIFESLRTGFIEHVDVTGSVSDINVSVNINKP